VVGGGYIGLELGHSLRQAGRQGHGSRGPDRILPTYDAELTKPVAKRLQALGVDGADRRPASGLSAKRALGVGRTDGSGSKRSLPADRIVLVTVGRKPAAPKAGAWNGSTSTMTGPFIRIDERCRTSMRGVWAIGDVTGEPMLAHRAMAQGEMVAEIVAGQSPRGTMRGDPRRLLHRSGNRHRRPLTRRLRVRRA
jgi:dihydrolipoamide dehydrogenase